MRKKKSLEERFWPKVIKTQNCWLWNAGKDERGYGKIFLKHGLSPQKAHRISWILTHGEILNNLCVLHKCDVPACVNPDHLYLGTHKDNTEDAKKRNRHSKGQKHVDCIKNRNDPKGIDNFFSKLDDKKVIEIRKMYSTNLYSHRKLAKIFGVSHRVIGNIINKKAWKHVL